MVSITPPTNPCNGSTSMSVSIRSTTRSILATHWNTRLLDPVPQFVSYHLDKSLLKPVDAMNGGTGTVQYRRALQPTVFFTTWSYIDHLSIPPGASIGSRALPDFAEVYYVISGEGTITLGSEKAKISKDDVIPVRLNEARSIQNTGSAPMEFLIVGVAKDMAAKDALMAHPPKP